MFLRVEPNSYIFCTKGGSWYWLLEGGGSIDHSPYVFIHMNQFSSPTFPGPECGIKRGYTLSQRLTAGRWQSRTHSKLACL